MGEAGPLYIVAFLVGLDFASMQSGAILSLLPLRHCGRVRVAARVRKIFSPAIFRGDDVVVRWILN